MHDAPTSAIRALPLAAILAMVGCSGGGSPAGTAPPLPTAPATPTPDEILLARLRQEAKRPRHVMPEPTRPPPEPPLQPQGSVSGDGAPGPLAPSVIQAGVRGRSGQFRRCYGAGLARNPKLTGQVVLRFTIERDGSVANVRTSGDLPDAAVLECIAAASSKLSFPKPEGGGAVNVTYPIMFSTGDEEPDAGAAGAPAPTAVASAKPSASPLLVADLLWQPTEASDGERWPIVAIDGERVLVDSVAVAETRSIVERGVLRKVDGVFETLKARSAAYRARHPNEPFPGVIGLRAAPDTPLLVFKSVFQTAVFGGYGYEFVQLSTEPTRIVELEAQLPRFPIEPLPADFRPEPVLYLHVEERDVAMVWKRGATLLEEKMAGAAPLTDAVCAGWKTYGVHRDPADAKSNSLTVHANNAVPVARLLATFEAVDRCRRPWRAPDGSVREIPVFGTTFSVR